MNIYAHACVCVGVKNKYNEAIMTVFKSFVRAEQENFVSVILE